MRANALKSTRVAAYVASAALVISGTVLTVAPAGAANDTGPMDAASHWLNDQFNSGLIHNDGSGDDDYDLTIDAGLALIDTGGHADTVQLVTQAIADNIDSYTTGGTPGAVLAGHVAKAAVFARAAGDNPESYRGSGGVDLIATLEQRVVSTPDETKGRIQDSGGTDTANTLGQAYAVKALTDADPSSSKAADAAAFLLKQQCSSGYFRLNFSATNAVSQSCVNGQSAPDPDATAIAVLQLKNVTVTGNAPLTTAVTMAVNNARAWLRSQQRCDGSFAGAAPATGSNAYSTGVVSWALGNTLASRQAASWLLAHQATPGDAENMLSGQIGAIAFDDAALTAGRSTGITGDETVKQWRRATAQAGPGIRWWSSDPAPAISLTGATAYLKAGSHPIVTTTGAAAGTVLCLTGPGTSTRAVAGSTAWSSAVNLPAGTATRVYTARDPFGNADTVTLKALGARRLPVSASSYKVKRNHYVTATVHGLAPKEWSQIFYRGAAVGRGYAWANGTFRATFRVGSVKGFKSITGYGRFTDIRRGATTIKVVR